MISKKPGPPGKLRITFSLPSSFWADSIHLVGDFNNWNTTATPLKLKDDDWSVTLDLDLGRSFHYRYLVNSSEWINDWQSDAFAQNEHGEENSVVVAMLPQEMTFFQGNGEMKSPSSQRRSMLRLIPGGRSDSEEKQAV
jgi:1,4-alpha-glucan branching enzyme